MILIYGMRGGTTATLSALGFDKVEEEGFEALSDV